MKMSVKKFAELTGVSVRTLHYYDEIGLLKPDFVDVQTSYRYYGEKAFLKMQEILFYRELNFSLKVIKEIISSPKYNKKEALKGQKELLLLKKERLEKIIEALESAQKGEKIMSFDVFVIEELKKAREGYSKEAKERWGTTAAYKESEKKTFSYSEEKWAEVAEGLDNILAEFAFVAKSGFGPDDERATELAARLREFITETQYNCTKEIFLCLGEMYVSDERFKVNIDKHGKGTAEFIKDAITIYCNK